jgi:hypothetical protein
MRDDSKKAADRERKLVREADTLPAPSSSSAPPPPSVPALRSDGSSFVETLPPPEPDRSGAPPASSVPGARAPASRVLETLVPPPLDDADERSAAAATFDGRRASSA